jgi:hypothetical protein
MVNFITRVNVIIKVNLGFFEFGLDFLQSAGFFFFLVFILLQSKLFTLNFRVFYLILHSKVYTLKVTVYQANFYWVKHY